MTNMYPQNTTEMVYMPVTNNGTVITSGVSYSIVKSIPGEVTTEGTFTPADVVDGKTGRIISDLEPGTYKVWAAVTGYAGEEPHVYLGTFRIVP